MEYTPNNIIQWVFEKIFDQLTFNSKDLLKISFDKIKSRTFDNHVVQQTICNLTTKPTGSIYKYLKNEKFQSDFLFGKLRNRLLVAIIMNDSISVEKIISSDCKMTNDCYLMAAINGYLPILKLLVEKFRPKLDSSILMHSLEHSTVYFYLRSLGIVPNISVFNQASLGSNLEIITDINEIIGISDLIMKNVFQANCTEIMLYLIPFALKSNINLKNLAAYAILNSNYEVLELMEKEKIFEWHRDLYYSALLSGSISMVTYVESKMPNIHNNFVLDMTKSNKKGYSNILLDDMIYESNRKKYFSHTMNYAVQSNSVEILDHICSKGYGITLSNIMTCIKQSRVEILEYLLKHFHQKLPDYFMLYFGISSYIPDKLSKIKLLLKNNSIDILSDNNKLSIDDHRKKNTHLQMINQNSIIDENITDIDYLMKYRMFFIPPTGFKLNSDLITRTKILLEINQTFALEKIFSSEKNFVNKQLLLDVLFLFGNITQIKKFYPIILQDLSEDINIEPSSQIIMEIMCYCQIPKLQYLLHNNLLKTSTIKSILPLEQILADKTISKLFQTYFGSNLCPNLSSNSSLVYVLKSGKISLVEEWIKANSPDKMIDIKICKEIIDTGNLSIVEKFSYDQILIPDLIERAHEQNLVEIKNYLKLFETIL